tara:strand:- start:1680 stop:2645 length:966 start_codon:yes stop_codon:yes gene_type:complete
MAPNDATSDRPGAMDTEVDYTTIPKWLKGLLTIDNPLYPGSNYYTVFQKGVNQGWFVQEVWQGEGRNNFMNAILETDEYRNTSLTARDYLAMKAADPETYEMEIDNAKAILRREASAKGYNIEDQIDVLAEQYLMDGWGSRPEMMQEILSNYTRQEATGDGSDFFGEAGDNEEILKTLARENGVQMSEGYFSGAVLAIQKNLGNLDDYEREIRENAASAFPMYRDRVLNGENVMDLVSPYMRVLSDTYEIDMNQIDLNDDFLRMGLDGGEGGVPMSLWDYKMKLREQPYWLNNTQQGRDKMVDTGTQVLRRMGILSSGGTY